MPVIPFTEKLHFYPEMKSILSLLLLLFTIPSLAQRGVIHYTRENGLIANKVRDVAYDSKGFLWIATGSGIDRFDGQRFIHFQHDPDDRNTICSNHIMRIAYDSKGFVWAATMNGGLIRISTKTLRVKNYFHDPAKPGSISDNRATAIFIDPDGETWISPHYRGLDYYDMKHDRFVNYRPTSQIAGLNPRRADLFSSIVADRNDPDIFWCASLDGLFSFNRKTRRWKHFPVTKNTFMEHTVLTEYEPSLRCLEQDGKGNLYIGTWGGGLLYFDKNQGLYRRFLFQSLLPPSGVRNSITDVKWRDSRYLYVCAEHFDFLLFDTKTKEFIRYDEAERSISTPSRIARNGTQIAIAGSELGLYIHNESLIFGERERYPFDIRQMAFNTTKDEWLACNGSNQGEVFFRDAAGNGKVYRLFNRKSETEFEFHFVKYMGKNGYFAVGTDRIARFSPETGLKQCVLFSTLAAKVNPTLLVPTSVFNDGDSVLWIGTKYGGMLHYSVRSGKLDVFLKGTGDPARQPLHNSWFFSFTKYGNTLYYGYEEGIGAIDLRTGTFYRPEFAGLLPRDQIRSLAIDGKGILWVGTLANGIFELDTKKKKILHVITDKMGLQTQQANALVFDNHNCLWVLNPNCVAVINRSNYSIQSLENQHGMTGVYDIALHGNRLYFLQNNGYITSLSGSPLPAFNSPEPYIQRVRELNDLPFTNNKHSFAYDENNLGFEFGVLDYSNSTNNFVSYRLKGLENAWRSGNGKDEATYYNLPGGKYVFQVRLVEDGRTRIAEYPFKIIPPFWTHWWFILLAVLAVAFSLGWYIRLRIRRIESTERMHTEFNRQINEMESKALRAQMNPHFLFNSLNSIRLFILKNEVESASDYIAKFSKLLRMILNHSRLDSITVYDEIQTLKLYLEFERLRFDHGFEFDIEIDGQEVLDYHLPPMIIQPFVENAIWHGLMPRQDDNGYIRVSFEIQPGLLYVTVRDNGIGREKARINNRRASLKEGSVGLKITKDRLRTLTKRTKRLNDYVIEDLTDENNLAMGTLIKLYFETEEKP